MNTLEDVRLANTPNPRYSMDPIAAPTMNTFPAINSLNGCNGIPNGSATVDLWHFDLKELESRHENKLLRCLTAEEQNQASRYLREATGWQFRLTRGALRHILSAHLHIPPQTVPIVRLPMGKPALALQTDAARVLSFNVSHSGGQAVVATCQTREVGVDIETQNRTLDVLGMAERFFAPQEAEELRTLDPSKQLTGFLRLWTRKEAFLKGQGRGLSQDWTDICVGPLDQSPLKLASSDRRELWLLSDLYKEWDLVAAVAIAGAEEFTIRWHEGLEI